MKLKCIYKKTISCLTLIFLLVGITGCVSHPVFMVNTNDVTRLKNLDPSKVDELAPFGGQYTAIFQAASDGKTEFVKVLLDKGANPNVVGSNGSSPLLEAANGRHEDILRLLLDAGADPNFRNVMGATPLLFAIGTQVDISIIEEMLNKGANPNLMSKDAVNAHSALKIAVENRRYDVVDLLIDRDVDITLPREHPPVVVAAQTGELPLLKKFLALGADINQIATNDGSSIMQYALGAQQWQIAEYLNAQGADPSNKNYSGENALHLGVAFGMPLSLIDDFILQGIPVDDRAPNRSTALIIASRYNQTDAALRLIKRSADVRATNNVGDTALHWAVVNNNFELIRMLVSGGANINAISSNGVSPVSLANNNSAIISILRNNNNIRYSEPPQKTNLPKEKNVPKLHATGSGFFINENGQLLTNYHVIEGCDTFKVVGELQSTIAEVLAFDARNDIALLKTNLKPDTFINLNNNRNIPLGEEVTVLGYPLTRILGNTLKITTGNISSHAGIGGDTSRYQISAPIQAGNSGGPVFDEKGFLAGIAVATLSLPIDVRSGSLPQNVNYAIKSTAVIEFLDANNVKFSSGNGLKQMTPKEIVETNEQAVLMVQCFR
ncbi:serine/threonine-protein phosphatase 6 regulatory ankyrin repeat subunit B [Glaciecola punicea ACAM 611]|uniref:Serine/threonine-protein phosphatase 6 regulatory ankyrin repeat subunit B n=1 Tax=Glaciecola punicea ACAM 611 TaxID=1121923 RepID=H5T9P7_9ALTE|nr:ankyrin repeat domain-containing protein [Glaciecola punicea]GAB55024.1 serine/threonine-protein phosphatase 6 regulatory ankyrin repeat subunit B [Glaciecola punicea ACAM 611]